MSNAQPPSIDNLLLEQKISLLEAKKGKKNKNEQKKTENPSHHVRSAIEQREKEHGGMFSF